MTFPLLDETHDPARTSWVDSANGHASFPIQNLPFGIFSTDGIAPRPGVAIGDLILDLSAIATDLDSVPSQVLFSHTLNALMALPAESRRALRRQLSALLSDPFQHSRIESALVAASDATMHLPAQIGDYTDFYVGIHHATNVGKLFRPDNPLLPNYKHVPIGYHGRASSIRLSGEAVRRPMGQRKAPDADAPVFAPCARLDFELEMGVWIGEGNALGTTIPIDQAPEHVAGLCLLNDWSARDIQAWEYQPLGPFLAKNFHSTISPWVVTSEALAPFRIAQPPRPEGDPKPLPYLWNDTDQALGAYAITLESAISTAQMRSAGAEPFALGKGPATNMYWTIAQMVTHHTSGGCNLNPGDLLGTGTISTPDDSGYGSLLEASKGGTQPIILPNGEERRFVEDGDEILFTATAHAPGRVSIGFGTCRAVVLPSSL